MSPKPAMKWASSLSQSKSAETALHECLGAIQKSLGRQKPDLVTLFVSPHFEKEYSKIHKAVLEKLACKALIGCTATGIIGAGREVEGHAALSLSAGVLPEVKLYPFRVEDDQIPDLDAGPKAWHQLLSIDPSREPHFVVLSDPFSIRTENFLMGLDFAYPGAIKVGGLASGGSAPGKNLLFINDSASPAGLVGVALTGNIKVDALVAQGCRPIGQPLQVTACDQNILLELDGKLPLAVLEDIYESLEPRDQELMQNSLFLGVATDPSKMELGSGDFLVRNVMALDAKRGILAVGAILRVGQTVQFHLRDARTSHDDLKQVLSRYSQGDRPFSRESSSHGVLLFSCLGRGSYLYKQPNHDSELFQKIVGQWPIAGFFCNGEIGPVGKTTYLHGYTSCFGILSPKTPA